MLHLKSCFSAMGLGCIERQKSCMRCALFLTENNCRAVHGESRPIDIADLFFILIYRLVGLFEGFLLSQSMILCYY